MGSIEKGILQRRLQEQLTVLYKTRDYDRRTFITNIEEIGNILSTTHLNLITDYFKANKNNKIKDVIRTYSTIHHIHLHTTAMVIKKILKWISDNYSGDLLGSPEKEEK